MRILMIEHSGKSGMYTYTDALCEGLHKCGTDVTVLTSSAWPEKERPFAIKRELSEFTRQQGTSSKLHWAADRMSRSLVNILRRNKFALSEDFDVVHLQGAGLPLLDQIFLKPLAKKLPLVLTVHDVMSHYDRFVSKNTFMKNNLQIPHRLIVHYEHGKNLLTKHWDIEADKIDVIPHGIMPLQNKVETKAAREKFNLPLDKQILLFFGSIRENKGLEVLLKSMKDVLKQNPKAFLVIAGAIQREISFQKYSDIITQLNISENIREFIKIIPDEDVDYFFAASDVVILPYTKFASQSGVLLRAYAHEKPVVVSDVGAMGQLVNSDEIGLVVEPANEKALTQAIIDILSNSENYKSRYNNQLKSRYDWKQIANMTLGVYEKAITQKSKNNAIR